VHAGSAVQVAHANGAQGVAHAWSCTRGGAKGSGPGKAPQVVSKLWSVLVCGVRGGQADFLYFLFT
jgi:hypothetical protein